MRVAGGTGGPGRQRSSASRARCFPAPRGRDWASAEMSSGPRTANFIALPDKTKVHKEDQSRLNVHDGSFPVNPCNANIDGSLYDGSRRCQARLSAEGGHG